MRTAKQGTRNCQLPLQPDPPTQHVDSRPSAVASLQDHTISSRISPHRLPASCLPVQRIVRVSSLPKASVESVGDVGAGALSLLVDLGDVDLDGCVVLGGDETVGGGALAGDVEVDNLALERGGSFVSPSVLGIGQRG